jgi:hypothetical protein
MCRIGMVETQAWHRLERNACAPLRQPQASAQLALEKGGGVVLVVANPVLAASVRSTAMVDVMRRGVEIHARDTVLILEGAPAVRIWTESLTRPGADVVAEAGIYEELGLRREPVDVTHANIMDD